MDGGGQTDYGSINRAVNKYRQEWLKKHINIIHNGYNGQPILPKCAQNPKIQKVSLIIRSQIYSLL